jgi:hypothetical protein
MANTRQTALRIPPELEDAARASVGQPDAPLSVLVRAGLAMLAGLSRREALAMAQARPGPKARAETTA